MLKACQDKYFKVNDTHKDSLSFPIGSTVTVQYKDSEPWIHCIAEETNSTDHNRWSYFLIVPKTGRLIMHNMRHICSTVIKMEWYLKEQIKMGLDV